MDDRGIIPASGGIAHPTTGGIVAMMGGINPMPGCITPMTCCITPMTCCIIPIPNTGNIVFLLMMAVIVPKQMDNVPGRYHIPSPKSWSKNIKERFRYSI
jgi:hypothetical protein